MLTQSRKRHYGDDHEDEEEETLHQAKRLPSNPLYPELGHDVWDINSSSSESSGISSLEQFSGAGSITQTTEHMEMYFLQDSCSPCSTGRFDKPESQNKPLGKTEDSYDHINRILREAHFGSLKIHGQQRST